MFALHAYPGGNRKVRLPFNAIGAGAESCGRAGEKPDAVRLWRAASDKGVQRAVNERQARRYSVDVVEINWPDLEMVSREKVLSKFFSPYLADPPAGAS
ncbi:MAG: hypothetical protein NVSMB6_25620 [Burkholderiaceae bacterium]